jgi:hypothetical protein
MAGGAWVSGLKKALVYHWNLLFVGVAGALAAISQRPDVVLPLAAAGEIAYLALLSTNARFQRLALAEEGADEAPADGSAEETLRRLSPADRARYQRLSDLCTRLRRLSAGDTGGEPLGIPDLQLQNIDRLLGIFLRLLGVKSTLERFFATVEPAELQRGLDQARERLAALDARGGDPSLRAKRRATLLDTVATTEARLEQYRRVRENHETILLELERLHTKIAGIAELGIDRHDAAAIGREIDLVASTAEDTERTMREIEVFAGADLRDAEPPGAQPRRTRVGTRAGQR